MDQAHALAALSALGQDIRLTVFRGLVRAGPRGMLAGEIAAAHGIRPNTLSAHLGILQRAGLVESRREGRAIRYFADMNGIRAMLAFLLEDCCGGHPDLCRPVLATLTPVCREPAMPAPWNVLFVCTGNSARSILAEAILNHEGRGRFRGFSAGSQPRGAVHPLTLELLARLGHDTSFARSKSWDEFAGPGAPRLDFIFTVCDQAGAEPCPLWPGAPMTAHWGIPDPAAAEGTLEDRRAAFARAYRQLHERISAFVALPVDQLDRMALQRRLADLGRTAAPPAVT